MSLMPIVLLGVACLLIGIFGKTILRGLFAIFVVPFYALLMSGPIAVTFAVGSLIVGTGLGSVVTWLLMR